MYLKGVHGDRCNVTRGSAAHGDRCNVTRGSAAHGDRCNVTRGSAAEPSIHGAVVLYPYTMHAFKLDDIFSYIKPNSQKGHQHVQPDLAAD